MVRRGDSQTLIGVSLSWFEKGGRHRVGENFAGSFVAVVREDSFRLRSIGQDRLTSSREKKTKLALKLTVYTL